jgi:outer membrane protein, heavy metal efflux system
MARRRALWFDKSMRTTFLPSVAILSLCWTAWCCPASADPVAQWVQSSRGNNAEILKARAEFRAALAKVPQAKSLPDPAIELETMGADSIGAEQTVRLAQAFPWPGTLGRRGSEASLQARAYWHEVQQLELAMASRVRVLATEIAYLQREKSLVAQNLELFKKQEEYLEQATRGGAEVSDLVRVEMESGLLADELARIDEMIVREAAELEAIIGRKVAPAEIARLAMPTGVNSPRESKRPAVMLEAANPGLQALALRVEAARAGLSLARLETLPEFMVGAGYRRVDEPGMGGGREWMNEAVVMISVSLPIWGAKNQGRRDEAAAMVEAAQSEHLNASRMLRARFETLMSRGRDARRRAGLYQDKLLPKARQAHEAVEASYRAGRAGLLDVFASRRALLETETGYWRAVADSRINEAEISALFGTEIQHFKP